MATRNFKTASLAVCAVMLAPSAVRADGLVYPQHLCNNIAQLCNVSYEAYGYSSALECWQDIGAPYCPQPDGSLPNTDGPIFGPQYANVRPCGGWLDCNR